MEAKLCSQCNSNMDMIDTYERFLEPDEICTDQISDNFPIGKQFVVNVEIYKCSKCGSYRAISQKGEFLASSCVDC